MKTLSIMWNKELVLTLDREVSLSDEKRAFLERMDRDMDRGIRVNGVYVAAPDIRQRTMFVVVNLIKAMQQDNEPVISASSAWLTERLPDVSEVHASSEQGRVGIELVENATG